MDTDQTIHDEFTHGDLAYLDAIERLQTIGHNPQDAERLVNEWIDGEQYSLDSK